MGSIRKLAWVLATGAGLLGAAPAFAQGTITGRVTDGEGGHPLTSVTVTVQGTRLGAVTGDDGTYSISRVPAGSQTVTARRIGFTPVTKTVTVTDNGTVTVNFALGVSATNLEQVVVTGTAGNQTREAQGAVVSSINAADVISKAPVSNVTDVLAARTPGVSISTGSGTSGAAPRINIRGVSSISLSNEPLVFVDGIRVDAGNRSPYLNAGTSPLQLISGLNDINPDDIESIEVVKGPAAATLYGSDASAGVIQIITKKGKLGAKQHFTQRVSAEFQNIDPNFTPNTNYAKCTAANLAAPGCAGKADGDVISFNPLVENNVFSDGHLEDYNYSGQGGGESYSFYVSAGMHDEKGTTPNNFIKRRSGRGNLTWVASPKLSLDANLGISWNDYKIPPGDQDLTHAWLGTAALSSPVSGWISSVPAISNILNEDNTIRNTPSATLHYDPTTWLTNRLTLGGDLNSTKTTTFYPKNNQNWYADGPNSNDGRILARSADVNVYTVDYLGNIKTSLFGNDNITSNLSFGSQYINTATEIFGGNGFGIVTNANNLISSTTQPVGSQGYVQSKQFGLLAQEQVGFGEKLFVQAGARVDKFSSFGSSSPSFFLPKVSASYVISKEGFWQPLSSLISTMRLRAAYGTTGRAPFPGASLTTYNGINYVTSTGQVKPGVSPGSPGNQDLKAERGKELEMGFDAGFFNERAGLELTYYHKKTDDLLLQVPLSPSLGFPTSPYTNIGSVLNSGFEFSLHGTPIAHENFTWDANFTGSTLHNELLSLGGAPPINNSFREFVPGHQIAAWYAQKVTSVDVAAGKAFVTDTAVPLGNQWPTFQGSLSSTMTFFKNLRLYALFNTKRNFKVYNLGQEFSDRNFPYLGEVNLPAGQGGYSDYERLRHLGPYYSATTGNQVSATGVKDPYIQDATFIRFQELSLTYTLPRSFAKAFRASDASITVGGRNLHLWKSDDYGGYDPEILGTGAGSAGTVNTSFTQLFHAEVYTVPPDRRWLARINLSF